MKRLRLILSILVAVLFTSILVACGGGGQNANDDQNGDTTGYTVEFYYNNALYSTIKDGEPLVFPEIPGGVVYYADGWYKEANLQTKISDTEFSAIRSGLHLFYAVSRQRTYSVDYKNFDGTLLAHREVGHGNFAYPPQVPEREGYRFTGWNMPFDTPITLDTVFIAQFVKQYTVTFKGLDEGILKTQTVDENDAATEPDAPNIPGKRFDGWDTAFNTISEDTVVKAIYTNIFTVRFYTIYEQPSNVQIIDENASATPPLPTAPDGYRFARWSQSADNVTANLDIYAEYIKIWFVTVLNDENVYENAVAYDDGSLITEPLTPSKTGYTFAAWLNQNGDNLWDFGTDKIESNIFLYPVFTENSYTIVFDANGGEGAAMGEIARTYNDAAEIPVNTYSKLGYRFAYWTYPNGTISDSGSTLHLCDADGVTLTLTAVWIANTYSIIYLPNGGEGETIGYEFSYGEVYNLTQNGFEITGYTFKGWAASQEDADSEIVSYSDRATVFNLTAVHGATIELYAAWHVNSYSVEYRNLSAGTGETASSNFIYDIANNLTVNGFIDNQGRTFAGWALTQNGNAYYLDGEEVINLTPVDGAEIELYAVWGEAVYCVEYDPQGGAGEMRNTIHLGGVQRNLAFNLFSKTGYHFIGWTAEIGSDALYANGAPVTDLGLNGETVTLYAVWGANTYQVNYYPNGGTGAFVSTTHTYDTPAYLANSLTYTPPTGYTFDGWSTTEGGLKEYNAYVLYSNLTDGNDGVVALYAVWIPNPYSVYYHINYVGNDAWEESVHRYDMPSQLKRFSDLHFSRPGYTFLGWALEPNGSIVYSNMAPILNLTPIYGEVVHLYARWGQNVN